MTDKRKVWCNYCDQEHDERYCSIAMVRHMREDKFDCLDEITEETKSEDRL